MALPLNVTTKHFTTTDPVNNSLDSQYAAWKAGQLNFFVSNVLYAAVSNGTAVEYSMLVIGYTISAN